MADILNFICENWIWGLRIISSTSIIWLPPLLNPLFDRIEEAYWKRKLKE